MMVGKVAEDINVQVPYDAYPQDKDGPTFKAYLTIIVRNEKGEIVKVHKQWSHSPTANFIGLLLPTNWYSNTKSNWSITDTGGFSYSFNPNVVPPSYPTTHSNYPSYLAMIQVGSGQQSNPYNAYSLAAPIANGSGTGQLLYGTPSVSQTPTVSGSSIYFTIAQTLNNQSGGTVTITEVGVVIYLYLYNLSNGATTTIGNTLVWYDVLSSSISIPNGGSVTIYYTFTVNP